LHWRGLKASYTPLRLQDTVPRGGKFLSAYKRNGQRVIVNRSGDIVVRHACVDGLWGVYAKRWQLSAQLLNK